MDLKKRGINTRNWIELSQDGDYWRILANAALYFRVLYAMEIVKPIKKLNLWLTAPGEPHRSTRLLQLTGRLQYDGIM